MQIRGYSEILKDLTEKAMQANTLTDSDGAVYETFLNAIAEAHRIRSQILLGDLARALHKLHILTDIDLVTLALRISFSLNID